MASSLHFNPLLDAPFLWGALAVGLLIFGYSFMAYRRGMVLRVIVFGAFVLALLNPSLLQEERSYVRDVAAIVVDRSASQDFGQRRERTDDALNYLKDAVEKTGEFDLRIIEAPGDKSFSSRTDLFAALDQALVDIPVKRRAGVIFLSDGQVHDAPERADDFGRYGPVHVLLSGDKGEKDRRIEVTQAPAYGLVGKEVLIKYRVEDTRNIGRAQAQVSVHHHDGKKEIFTVPIGQEVSVTLPLEHAGQNVFSLSVDGVEGEITQANNKAAVLINGVRDRLKVLLVSGTPHSGERTWRDLLTSDPGVDLVHFTILRGPENSLGFVPSNELSLIAFPYQELFEVKLYDFDLIIFDKYRLYNILSDRYFNNIVRYVRKGGALLVSSGPDFAGNRSIYDTPLGDILPAKPSGTVVEQRYVPHITKLGHSHPVTRSLVWKNQVAVPDGDAPWGSWLRYVDVSLSHGDVLMSALNDRPLLVLERVDEGRVAQIASDHIWLWSRGYDGGGPHAELLRRIVHWLMKEPELDERALNVDVYKNRITVEKNSYGKQSETLAMETPDADISSVDLSLADDGMLRYVRQDAPLGITAFEDSDGFRKYAIVGDLDPLELRDVRTTDEKLKPLVTASKGAVIWMSDEPRPRISARSAVRRYGGGDWLALRRNNDYTVTGVRNFSLLPEWALLLGLMGLALLLWWREGQTG